MANTRHTDESHDDLILKPDQNITFDHKSSLKRSEETGIPLEDEKAIAMMEGDRGPGGADASLAAIYIETRLKSDHSITYPDPSSLKKSIVIIPMAARYAAAATILLLISIGAWFIFSPEVNPERVQYELARIEGIRTTFNQQDQYPVQLQSRTQETMQIKFTEREMIQIDRIESSGPETLIASTALASANPLLNFRSSAITDPTFNPSTSISPGSQVYAEAEPKERSLAGKIFSGIFGKLSAPLEGNAPATEKASSDSFSLWRIAQLGVKGVNAMGDHDYTLVRDYNDKGNVKGLIVLEE